MTLEHPLSHENLPFLRSQAENPLVFVRLCMTVLQRLVSAEVEETSFSLTGQGFLSLGVWVPQLPFLCVRGPRV